MTAYINVVTTWPLSSCVNCVNVRDLANGLFSCRLVEGMLQIGMCCDDEHMAGGVMWSLVLVMWERGERRDNWNMLKHRTEVKSRVSLSGD